MNLTSILFMLIFIIPIVLGVLFVRRSRKVALSLISIPFIFMIGVMGWWVYEANHRFTGSTDLANERIDHIELHITVNDSFKSEHGKYEKEDDVRFREYLHFDTFSVGTNFEENKIVYIETEVQGTETAKGIQVGDTIEKVINTYGDSHYKSNEMGQGRTINFIDRKANIHLQFWLQDDVVQTIAMYAM